ncbi:MAG: ATP-dependent DNA ligase [Deltaproteobacteria bacterium]|nr:MAG: ATP-dependent DNA ligase [Deltaproteobacteria bacterium]
MKLHTLVETFHAVRATRSRKRKTGLLAELLASVERSHAVLACHWLSGELPQGKIGVGFAMLRDLELPEPPDESQLGTSAVDAVFSNIDGISGTGSKARRVAALTALFAEATTAERQFLGMLLVGELRQGALDGVMVEAVAEATELDPALVRRAYMLTGSLPEVARAALLGGEAAVAAFKVEVFRPLMPMLAQTAASPEEVLGDGKVLFDHKLDGVRVQAHKDGHRVRLFSRHLRELTGSAPEVVELVRSLPAERLILDGEALALGPDGPMPFQTTMRRFGRKLDVAKMRAELPLTPVFFDVLLHDDRELLDVPLTERLDVLDALLPEAHRMPRLHTADLAEADAFYEDAIDGGHEGIMAKDPTSTYAAGARGRAWRKIKATHTLDLVVLGAEWGSGRRQGWLSNLHLGARDADGEVGDPGDFVMLGKTFKGLTDALLAWQTEALLARETHRNEWQVFARPELVVEIAFNDVQRSPQYPGGVALRFARVKRYREDKRAEDADTLATVRALLPEGL